MSKPRKPDAIARAGKNPAAVDFSAESWGGATLADDLAEMLDDDPRAISWMMNAIARAKAANDAGLTRREIRDHMQRIAEQAEQLSASLENPLWWDALLPPKDASEMKRAGYWSEGQPASPENETKARWRMIEDNMVDPLLFLSDLSKRARIVSEQADPKGAKQPNWPAHGLANELAEGIEHGILPLTKTHEQSVAQELFSIALKAANIKASKPLNYYLPDNE